MKNKSQDKNNDLAQKYLKKIPPEFMDSVEGMNTDEVKARIIQCEKNIYETEQALANDENLVAAKNNVKALSSAHKESKGVETAKIKYCLHILETRGN